MNDFGGRGQGLFRKRPRLPGQTWVLKPIAMNQIHSDRHPIAA